MAKKSVPAAATPKEVTSVRLDADVKAAIESAAEHEERTVSWLVNKILAEWLRSKKLL